MGRQCGAADQAGQHSHSQRPRPRIHLLLLGIEERKLLHIGDRFRVVRPSADTLE
jgi:hypothetical protein